MKYLAIDIETTGLDETYCQILEVGCVMENGLGWPVEDLPCYQTYLTYDRIQGEPFALNMNRDIIERILKHTLGYNYTHPESVYTVLEKFMYTNFPDSFNLNYGKVAPKITLAGKNVAMFDLRFLTKLKMWPANKFHRRIIDPAIYYWHPEDTELPDTATCMKRAGVEAMGKIHNAITDCRHVIELVRRGPDYRKQVGEVGGTKQEKTHVSNRTEAPAPESLADVKG